MPLVLSGMVVKVGTRASDASSSPTGIGESTPYISWTLPVGTTQRRFRVIIQHADPTLSQAYAVISSGIQVSVNQEYRLPISKQLTNPFIGLCRVTVEISSVDNPLADMESVSPPAHFVYDPRLDHLYLSDKVKVSWDQVENPDSVPNPVPSYDLQIARTPFFTTSPGDLVHSATVPAPDGFGRVEYSVNPSFNPIEDIWYFFRVRAYDGLDYGKWSRVNAFISKSTLSTSVLTIDDVRETGLSDRFVEIIFTIQGTIDQQYRVEFYYPGNDIRHIGGPVAAQPLCLIDPVHRVRPGTHTVTWRSLEQLGTTQNTITIYAVAYPEVGAPVSANYGPIIIDNTQQTSSSGGSPTNWDFVVNLGWITNYDYSEPDYELDTMPVAGEMLIDKNSVQHVTPVVGGRYLWRSSYVIGRTEEVNVDFGPKAGFSAINFTHTWRRFKNGEWYDDAEKFYRSWPIPMAFQNIQGPTWSSVSGDFGETITTGRVIPVSVTTGFLFYAPREDRLPTTQPTPHASVNNYRMNRFLKGYTDLDGAEHDYPNGYDWDRRPMWHVGREIWGQDDAWIQIATWDQTNYGKCDTCDGKGWVVEPYADGIWTRVNCTNPDCMIGFDRNKWLDGTRTEDDGTPNGHVVHWPKCRMFIRVQWHRLSTWMDGTSYTNAERQAFALAGEPFAVKRLHVVGRGTTSLEVKRHPTSGSILGYYITLHGETKLLPANVGLTWNFAQYPALVLPVTRQEDDLPLIRGDLYVEGTGEATDSVSDTFPVDGSYAGFVRHHQSDPVAGTIGPGKSAFYLGQSDPDSHPGHWKRPRPTQPGSLQIIGNLGVRDVTLTLKFRFLEIQPMWDSYTTIHYQHSQADNIRVQMQYRSSTSTSEGDWKDVEADNATFYPTINRWLLPPRTNHAFWYTGDHTKFPEGSQWNLRMRTVDINNSTDSGWAVSQTVTILHGIANPVSIIKTEYEPWSRDIKITLRIDDTQWDAYTLTRFWWALDPAGDSTIVNWIPIAKGDISGETSYLLATPSHNTHTIAWRSSSYALNPSDRYRIKIECIPSGLLENITLPFLKFLSPRNPYIDEGEAAIDEIMGHMVTQTFDDETNTWVAQDPPIFIPGSLTMLQREMLDIKLHPENEEPDRPGWFKFHDPLPPGSVFRELQEPDYDPEAPGNSPFATDYELVDEDGFEEWLESIYYGTEKHGSAIQRINQQIELITRFTLPEAQASIASGERRIRKRLIEQGFYAEDNFMSGGLNDGPKEWIAAKPVSNLSGDLLPTSVGRQWRFRVQNTADDGDNVFIDGIYNPSEVTSLEQVWYKVEMDATSTFDSQSFRRPLRRFITSHLGSRLSIAEAYTGVGFQTGLDPQVDPSGDSEDDFPDTDIDTGQHEGTASEPAPVNIAGVLKIMPELLPGQITQDYLDDNEFPPQVMPHQGVDQFATGQTEWNGTYYWRVAAYNFHVAAINAIPRPLITTMSVLGAELHVNYIAQAHEDIEEASVQHTFFGVPFGYRVSDSFRSPIWLGVASIDDATTRTLINWVSEIRADPEDPSRQINHLPWVPIGKDRPHPCVWYDDVLQQYVWLFTKNGFDGKPRIMSARAMSFPKACEYDMHFGDEVGDAVWGPAMVKVGDTYRLYVMLDPGEDLPAQIMTTTSFDADNWDSLLQVEGLTGDIRNVCIYYKDETYHMWYEKVDGGLRKIYYATSPDAVTFTDQNDGDPVYFDMVDVMKPNVTFLNGSWVMYYHDGDGSICSIISLDGIVWTTRTEEMTPATITIDSVSTAVTWANPHVFYDRFYGNVETMLAYNAVLPSGECRIFVSRLEDRNWRAGAQGHINGNVMETPFSRDGLNKLARINLSANTLDPFSNKKIRLYFSEISPETKEYHRQSDWVSIDNMTETASFLQPSPWFFDEQLLEYPYLKLFGT